MRQIVAGLTGDSDGTGDLAVELSKTDPASLETGQDSEDDSGEPEDWVPDPVDADPGPHPPVPPGLALWGGSRRACAAVLRLLLSALRLEQVRGQGPTQSSSQNASGGLVVGLW